MSIIIGTAIGVIVAKMIWRYFVKDKEIDNG